MNTFSLNINLKEYLQKMFRKSVFIYNSYLFLKINKNNVTINKNLSSLKKFVDSSDHEVNFILYQ